MLGDCCLSSESIRRLRDHLLLEGRLEMVYAPLFGCSRLPLWQLPALWRWRARFFTLEGVAATCCAPAWRTDYFGALFPLHPSGIVPAGPDLARLVTSPPPAPTAALP